MAAGVLPGASSAKKNWRRARQIVQEKEGDSRPICRVCQRPIKRGERRHHILPKCTRMIYGFYFNTWWNLEPRHASCENKKDSHLECKAISRMLNRSDFASLRRNICGLAAKLLANKATLCRGEGRWPGGSVGNDPFELLKIVARIPEEERTEVPKLLCRAIMEVANVMAGGGKPSPSDQERRMLEYAQRLAADAAGRIRISE